ncbi:glycosyl transferase [Candidatus Endobugula sertula]|uniref:Glycosyl transferase n=1 Tax=Candidatus Endobugula sertula TaxID=62101 RepID=A0A1D2QQ14_9GAMM|nr:glycosyl transferase [Candidatus Endobugula sertula]
MNTSFNPCIIIPVYNHEHGLTLTLDQICEKQIPIILVNDGSNKTCRSVMETLTRQNPLITRLIHHPHNLGKGGALKTGLQAAYEMGFSHALQVDADGQHNTDDIQHFIHLAQKHPNAIICGCPLYDESVPKHRFYARYLTHIWIWINCLSFTIKDSMCGFRCYPLKSIVQLIHSEPTGNRMEFDSEIMVRWVWQAGQVINLQTKVSYPIDGVSHFALWRDNLLISKMHTRLFFGMLWRLPKLLLLKSSLAKTRKVYLS